MGGLGIARPLLTPAACRIAILALLAPLAVTGCSGGGERPTPDPRPTATTSIQAAPSPAGQVRVYAATELTVAFAELGKVFESAYPGAAAVFTFDTGPSLAGRIVTGPAPDVFVTSGPDSMKQVTDAGAAAGAPRILVRDRLVIAVPKANPAGVKTLADLARVRVALCAAETACGRAARRALQTAGLTPAPVTTAPDATAALRAVAQGAADAALVHGSDVAAARNPPNSADLATIDTSDADEYPIVTLTAAPNPTGAAAFLGLVTSALARRTFTDAGFVLP
jgi:molybdate transport system substrate-binding protein